MTQNVTTTKIFLIHRCLFQQALESGQCSFILNRIYLRYTYILRPLQFLLFLIFILKCLYFYYNKHIFIITFFYISFKYILDIMFKCRKCLSMFTSKDNLIRHENTHVGNSFPWEISKSTFSNKTHLNKHMQNVHGIYEYILVTVTVNIHIF
jgi:hypothetical protein